MHTRRPRRTSRRPAFTQLQWRQKLMLRFSTSLALMFATPLIYSASAYADSAVGLGDEVIQWNKTLLTIVRTPGAQPATVHPTRSFAIMHAAVYDAVNSIDATHKSYLVRVEHVSPHASLEAAASAAAHETLITLYPAFQTTLDQQYDQSLAQIPDGADKTTGIDVGRAVAQATLTLRSDDGSAATPIPFVFGNAPGDYQSTPPNFPKPQFTHWSRVTPFALERANQFRLGPPPALTSAEYTASFNEVKSLGIANSTAATADQALIGRFWNGAIQNYWNEIAQTAVLAHHLTSAQSARVFALLNLTSDVLPGVVRSFDSFAAVESEASLSRVYAGQHFRSDENVGEGLGSAVADFVVSNFLTRVPGADDGKGDAY